MKRILIIEDDKFVATAYEGRLQTAGYLTKVATDGEMGLKLIKEYKPDLIQLDLNLPKVSGVDIIKWVRSSPDFKNTPIFVLTNGYLTNLVRQAWELGATKVLTKADCTPKVMLDVISRHFSPPQPPAESAPRPPAHQTPAPQPSQPASSDDLLFEEELRVAFRDAAPREVASLRALHHAVVKAAAPEPLLIALGELRRRVRSIASNAGVVGHTHLARLTSALEALLKEMYERPQSNTVSTSRTVAQAIDRIAQVIQKHQTMPAQSEAEPKILVVDDDIISRKAVAHALKKVGLNSLSVEDPYVAISLLAENRFDLIILDVDMPAMNGFELCKQLRTMPSHAETPVVFVTSLADFESRAKSSLSGASDLISKPFPFLELGVKALIHLFKNKS